MKKKSLGIVVTYIRDLTVYFEKWFQFFKDKDAKNSNAKIKISFD